MEFLDRRHRRTSPWTSGRNCLLAISSSPSKEKQKGVASGDRRNHSGGISHPRRSPESIGRLDVVASKHEGQGWLPCRNCARDLVTLFSSTDRGSAAEGTRLGDGARNGAPGQRKLSNTSSATSAPRKPGQRSHECNGTWPHGSSYAKKRCHDR